MSGNGKTTDLFHAVTGAKIAEASSNGIDFEAWSSTHDGRRTDAAPMTFHERARMLKAMAQHLMERKDEFYRVSAATGATRGDCWVDIEGGIGTLFAYASRGRRELPNETVLRRRRPQSPCRRAAPSSGGTSACRSRASRCTSTRSTSPCWGMLEKLAPTLLAGVPAIVKPATAHDATSPKRCSRDDRRSGVLPEGALQLICRRQPAICSITSTSRTSSRSPARPTRRRMLHAHPKCIVEQQRPLQRGSATRSTPRCSAPTPRRARREFDLFVKEVVREMTVKAGQKCTAIRRTFVPESMLQDVMSAIAQARWRRSRVGDPAVEGVRMGPLAGQAQVTTCAKSVDAIARGAELRVRRPRRLRRRGADRTRGAFFPPLLFYAATIRSHAHARARRRSVRAGQHADAVPRPSTTRSSSRQSGRAASWRRSSRPTTGRARRRAGHGGVSRAPHARQRDCAKESTGHGSPLPHLVHGGPGRAGGGEEMGGVRGVMHYMQRTALQGSPTTLMHVGERVHARRRAHDGPVHPFRKYFDELQVGDTLVTERAHRHGADIVNFAGIQRRLLLRPHGRRSRRGESFFGGRVAHGYFVLSAAAGLFVDPAAGPGAGQLRARKPSIHQARLPGDTIQADSP